MARSAMTARTVCEALVERYTPGLRQLLGYRREWLRIDLVAGVSVAAVAVPTAIAYAQLIGFEPIVGLYAAILPLVAYAVFGTSRQLIVNPDAAIWRPLRLARASPSRGAVVLRVVARLANGVSRDQAQSAMTTSG